MLVLVTGDLHIPHVCCVLYGWKCNFFIPNLLREMSFSLKSLSTEPNAFATVDPMSRAAKFSQILNTS
jgi:hypothetical protein